ncbi:hypothetical protein BHE74_00023834 [Ensete ventricosum]|nr:hypothetical protein BHE74_00023834 [Ensete ventricosum]
MPTFRATWDHGRRYCTGNNTWYDAERDVQRFTEQDKKKEHLLRYLEASSSVSTLPGVVDGLSDAGMAGTNGVDGVDAAGSAAGEAAGAPLTPAAAPMKRLDINNAARRGA